MTTILRKVLGLSALTVVAAGSSIAGAQYYGGLNFDLSRYATNTHGAMADIDSGFFIANTALDDRRIRYGLRLGYRYSPFVALVSRNSVFDRRDAVSPLARSYGLDLEGHLPILAKLALSGSAGIARLQSDSSFGGSLYSAPFSGPGSHAYAAGRLGLGVEYQFNSSVGLRFDVERYRSFNGSGMGELGADHLSLGVMLKF